MIVVEYRKIDFSNEGMNESFLRSFGDPPHRFVSVLYLIRPTREDCDAIRHAIAGAFFADVIVFLLLDRSAPDWRDTRDAVRVLQRYFNFQLNQVFKKSQLDLSDIFQSISDRVEGDLSPGLDVNRYVQIKGEDFLVLHQAIEMPARLRLLRHMQYYGGGRMGGGSTIARTVLHLNFLQFIADHSTLHFSFADESILEIGAGAGFVYRFAQAKGATEVVVIDKNAGFCTLAEIDSVRDALEIDLTSDGFCEALDMIIPGGVSYFFAKGVLNVYHYVSMEAYRNLVTTVTGKIKKGGVWVTYNVDRVNGQDQHKLALSREVFKDNGWKIVDVPKDLISVIGVNYPEDAEYDIWVLDRT
jgi:hypothetical protein